MSAADFNVKGVLIDEAPLGASSWFGCGGNAELLFRPVDLEDLQSFLQQYPIDKPLMVLGGLANTIVRDGGIPGCVVQLGKAFSNIDARDQEIVVGCGALNGSVASAAAKNGIGGLEFLSGVPGTLGGACAMNAGAYGTEVKDILVEVQAIDRAGNIQMIQRDNLSMSYRYTDVPDGVILIGAKLIGYAEDTISVKVHLKEIKEKRRTTQPITEKTGGSTFANPSALDLRRAGLPEDMRAWQVVEKVGGRGLQIGGAKMSEKHCNFMINAGNATASDLETLGDEIRRRAHDDLGLDLKWEIRRVGSQ